MLSMAMTTQTTSIILPRKVARQSKVKLSVRENPLAEILGMARVFLW